MGTTINMNQISRNINFGYWVLEHGNVPLKDVPVFLRDTVTRLAATNIGKLKGAVNIGIQVDGIKPFLKRQKVVALSIAVRRIGWTNKMCFCGKGWMFDVLLTMILKPITLLTAL
jgi:hypothetical protein